MSQLLKKAASPEVLNDSWKRLKNDKAMWSENISRKEMEKNIVFHLTKLADDLRSGSYKPSNVRFSTITKANGKKRIISAFTLRDKIAQRAVLSVIEDYGENIFHADSYAYRKGRSIEMAVSKAREYIFCNMEWLVDADIQKFFDEIPHSKLKKTLTRVIPDSGIVKLIHKWIDVGSTKTGMWQKRRGIPQGSIISPFICNVYLTDFDNFLDTKNLSFVRFADDFLIFNQNKKSAYKALSLAQKGLKKLDLQINEQKTQIIKSGPNVKFLGRKLPKPFKSNKSIGSKGKGRR